MMESTNVNIDFSNPYLANEETPAFPVEYIDLNKPRKKTAACEVKGPKFNEVGAEIEYIKLDAPTAEAIQNVKAEEHVLTYERKADPRINDLIKSAPCQSQKDLTTKEILATWLKVQKLAEKAEVTNCCGVMEKSAEKKPWVQGMVLFYINVGQLSPQKGLEMVERFKESNKECLDAIPSTILKMFIPNRENTRVEYLKF